MGGLIGYSSGTISNCYATGNVIGGENSMGHGGLVGNGGHGVIRNCFAAGSVTGGDNSVDIGGLIGFCYGDTITNCYASGSIMGGEESINLGGLLGQTYRDCTIENCYAYGEVVGGSNLGGLLGFDYHLNNIFLKNYWDNTINANISGIGNSFDPNVISESTENLQKASTFIAAGWDFVGDGNGAEDHWQMCVDGYDYPRLRWEFNGVGDFLKPPRLLPPTTSP